MGVKLNLLYPKASEVPESCLSMSQAFSLLPPLIHDCQKRLSMKPTQLQPASNSSFCEVSFSHLNISWKGKKKRPVGNVLQWLCFVEEVHLVSVEGLPYNHTPLPPFPSLTSV